MAAAHAVEAQPPQAPAAAIESMSDPAVADLMQRLEKLATACSGGSAGASKLASEVNLIFAHGMLRVGTRPCADGVKHRVLSACAQELLSAPPPAACLLAPLALWSCPACMRQYWAPCVVTCSRAAMNHIVRTLHSCYPAHGQPTSVSHNS